jgi:hypothetical protein
MVVIYGTRWNQIKVTPLKLAMTTEEYRNLTQLSTNGLGKNLPVQSHHKLSCMPFLDIVPVSS